MSQKGREPSTLPAGVVLCGGQSRRMGTCKAWLPVGSETMLARVVRLVGTTARPVIVVGAGGQELPPLPSEVSIVRDPVPNGGPLRGLATGFEALADSVELAYATAVDSPLLVPTWIDRLVELIGDHDAIVPRFEGRLYPLNAVFRPGSVLPVAQSLLAQGRKRLLDFIETVDSVIIDAKTLRDIDTNLHTIYNVNTTQNYKIILDILYRF